MSGPMQNSRDPVAEIYDMLLMEYASGALDDPLCLLVASHLTLSPAARRHLALYETVGGALISECCEPVAMAEQSLRIVLGKLDSCADDAPCTMENILHDAGLNLPQPLQRHMKAQACHTKKWRRARKGVLVMPIPLPPCRVAHRALLVRAVAGAALPRPRHIAREYTLVLQGCLRRQHDYFEPGDLFVAESETMPRPVVDSHEDSVCLVVAEAPPRRPGWLEQLFPHRY
jgi:putative transcriptional regulator